MKIIFGFLMFVAAVVITGGLYLVIRKPEQKKSDMERLASVFNQIAHYVRKIDDNLARIYTATFFRFFDCTRRGRAKVPGTQSTTTEFPHGSESSPSV
jgi:hypothetical protein